MLYLSNELRVTDEIWEHIFHSSATRFGFLISLANQLIFTVDMQLRKLNKIC